MRRKGANCALCDSRSSSALQTLHRNELGSLAKVVLVVAKTVPPTFNLTHEDNEANFCAAAAPFSAEVIGMQT